MLEKPFRVTGIEVPSQVDERRRYLARVSDFVSWDEACTSARHIRLRKTFSMAKGVEVDPPCRNVTALCYCCSKGPYGTDSLRGQVSWSSVEDGLL